MVIIYLQCTRIVNISNSVDEGRFFFSVFWKPTCHLALPSFLVCFGASAQASLPFFVEICLFLGSSVNPYDTDWSSRESGNTFITSLRTPFVWGPSGQTFAEEISSRLLIFNTSLHLHQLALRPERCETGVLPKPSHSLPPNSSSSRPSPAPLFHALIVSIWWLKHRGGHRHEQ